MLIRRTAPAWLRDDTAVVAPETCLAVSAPAPVRVALDDLSGPGPE